MKKIKRFPVWLIGIVITLLFVSLYETEYPGFLKEVEQKSLDLRMRYASRQEPNPVIEIVEITQDDLSEIGPFPWARDILAKATGNLALAGAKVIAIDIPISGPEETAGLKALRRLKDMFEKSGLGQQGAGLAFYKSLSEAASCLDNDAKLYAAIEKAGNVVLPVYFEGAEKDREQRVPQFIARFGFREIKGSEAKALDSDFPWLSRVRPVLPSIAEVAAGMGHINLFPDQDGIIRRQVHALGYLKGTYFPSFPLAIVKLFKGVKDQGMILKLNEAVELRGSPAGNLSVPVNDRHMSTYIHWNGSKDAFHRTRFVKVLKNQVRTSLFRDKIVIIGPAAPSRFRDAFRTPLSENTPGVEVIANSVANILDQRFVKRPQWINLVELGMLVLCGLYLSFVLPGMKIFPATGATAFLLALFVASGAFILNFYQIWLKITPSMILLLFGLTLIRFKAVFIPRHGALFTSTDLPDDRVMSLGISYQREGMLDLAFEEFSRLPPENSMVKGLFYNLGLDYEGKGFPSKALAVYESINKGGGEFRDIKKRISRLKQGESEIPLGQTEIVEGPPSVNSNKVLALQSSVGIYKIVEKMGANTLGNVYRVIGPSGDRNLFLLSLDLAEISGDKERDLGYDFLESLQKISLLRHPGIEAVQDFGMHESRLFIISGHLDWQDLSDNAEKGSLMSVRTVLDIAAQLLDALDYAHEFGVVHGDIRPENILKHKNETRVKLKNFGMSQLTLSVMRARGVDFSSLAGYMSPEQVSGKETSPASDIFSLGVVLFVLLTGVRPFQGMDITSTALRIARERHPSVRSLNPRIPRVIEKILDRCLEKDIKRRYSSAGAMASHIKMVIKRIDEIRAGKKI